MTAVLLLVAAVVLVGVQVAVYWLLRRVIKQTHGPSREMYQRGFELGKAAGWREGRRSARPVVVPMGERVG